MKAVKVAEIVEVAGSELQLEVLAGRAGFARTINVTRIQKPGLALTGYVDFVQNHRVQILGSTELTYLERLDDDVKRRACDGFCGVDISIIICTKGMAVPVALIDACERTSTPLASTPQTTDVFISRIEGWLEERLAPQTTMHGVLLEVFGLGVLMLGKSGNGKSELALDLVQRGHPLIADDIVTIRRRGVETLNGQGSGLTQHLLEIRGLGILNVKELFGVSAVREKKRIDLVCELVEWRNDEEYDRLGIDERFFTILDVEVPLITIPVRPGRNMGVIVEAAARNQLLKSLGHHSALDLQERLARELARGHVKSDEE